MTLRSKPLTHLWRLAHAALLPLVLPLASCSSNAQVPSDAVVVGLLLPFTGNTAATAMNFERAALYAADRINQGGGIQGHPLYIVSRDTHSDVTRSRAAVEALIDAGASVVVGPESPEIAAAIAPLLADAEVAFLSPLVGAANDAAVDCTHPWFRLAPSARSLGEALAKQLSAEGAASWTSGLLIGTDVGGALALFDDVETGAPVYIVGTPQLTASYTGALARHGRKAHAIDGEQAVLAGLAHVFRELS